MKITFNRIRFVISFIIRIILIFAVVYAAYTKNLTVLFINIIALILTMIPIFLRKRYSVYLPAEIEILFVVFIYAALILGEVKDYYTSFWWWDILLHGISGLALGFLGFMIMYALYLKKKVHAMPIFIALFAFSFALSLGAIWEVTEYGIDSLVIKDSHMQNGSLGDTMWDLILDASGAFIVSILGFLYIKKGKSYFIDHLIRRFVESNPSWTKKP